MNELASIYLSSKVLKLLYLFSFVTLHHLVCKCTDTWAGFYFMALAGFMPIKKSLTFMRLNMRQIWKEKKVNLNFICKKLDGDILHILYVFLFYLLLLLLSAAIFHSLSLLCARSGDGLNHQATVQPKTETDAVPLSRSRRRRPVKVEYDEADDVSPVKTEQWEPSDWKQQLGFIREMRSGRDAPVDNMGAEKCYDTEAPAPVGVVKVFVCLHNSVVEMNPFIIFFVNTGETFPGVGVTHAVQSDQGPGHSSCYAEAPSTRLHCGKYTRNWWRNTGETYLPCRLLEGNIKYVFFCVLLLNFSKLSSYCFVHALHLMSYLLAALTHLYAE